MKSLILATTSLNLSADTTAGEPDAQYRDESHTTPIPEKGKAGGVVPDVTPGTPLTPITPRHKRGFCLHALQKVEIGNEDCDWDLSHSPGLHQNPSCSPLRRSGKGPKYSHLFQVTDVATESSNGSMQTR